MELNYQSSIFRGIYMGLNKEAKNLDTILIEQCPRGSD
jgi:hypothetical protein